MTWLVAFALRPLLLMILFVTVLYPCRRLVEKRMTEGRLKRLLLRRVA